MYTAELVAPATRCRPAHPYCGVHMYTPVVPPRASLQPLPLYHTDLHRGCYEEVRSKAVLKKLLHHLHLAPLSSVFCLQTAASVNYRSVGSTVRDEETGFGGNSVIVGGDSIGGSIHTAGTARRSTKPRLIFGRAWA